MYKLNQFKEIKSPLLKEWQNEEITTAAAYCYFKTNINHNIIYEAGSRLEKYESEQGATRERLEDVFGLPYVSAGSEFAGLWNTNTQARAKYGEAIYFRAIAKAENGQTVLVFEDKSEQYYYFYEWAFLYYQKQEQAKEQAGKYCQFIKVCNVIKNNVIELLKSFKGKKYGEKTRQTIAEEIHNTAQQYNASAWLEVKSASYQYLTISAGANFTNYYYFNFVDVDNTIIEPQAREGQGESIQDTPEYNSVKEFDKAAKLAEKLSKKAAEILPIIKEFNKTTNHINARPSETETIYKVDLESIAAGGADFWRW